MTEIRVILTRMDGELIDDMIVTSNKWDDDTRTCKAEEYLAEDVMDKVTANFATRLEPLGPCKHCGQSVSEHVYGPDGPGSGFVYTSYVLYCKSFGNRYEGS